MSIPAIPPLPGSSGAAGSGTDSEAAYTCPLARHDLVAGRIEGAFWATAFWVALAASVAFGKYLS